MSYRISSQNEKTWLRTVDTVKINYEGKVTSKLYACTITSRKKFSSLYTFRAELYQFLKSIDYNYGIQGYMEYHNQKGRETKVHMHGVLFFGNVPKGNKHNTFTIKISKLATPQIWDSYCRKEIWATICRHHDIQTGIFKWHNKPYNLLME